MNKQLSIDDRVVSLDSEALKMKLQARKKTALTKIKKMFDEYIDYFKDAKGRMPDNLHISSSQFESFYDKDVIKSRNMTFKGIPIKVKS